MFLFGTVHERCYCHPLWGKPLVQSQQEVVSFYIERAHLCRIQYWSPGTNEMQDHFLPTSVRNAWITDIRQPQPQYQVQQGSGFTPHRFTQTGHTYALHMRIDVADCADQAREMPRTRTQATPTASSGSPYWLSWLKLRSQEIYVSWKFMYLM